MTSRRYLLACTLANAFVLCTASGVPAWAQTAPEPAAQPQQALPAWARVLSTYVNERGEVDFEALAAKPADINLYLSYVAQTPLDSFANKEERLAHMVNAYNALSMFNVVDKGIPTTHAGFNKISFFVFKKFTIGGQRLSLKGFEDDVIRPLSREMGLPEVHFALNCSAVSCPTLPRTPFTGSGIRAELERETRAFFARPDNFKLDAAERTVFVNEILDFYTSDFVPAHGANLVAYINQYAPQQVPADYRVRFVPYDWTVANSKRPK
jgi:Protein of unknown function, DUF547